MKKLFLIGATALMVSNSTFAGGILTNTNQNATFLRNPARNAAIAIDRWGINAQPGYVLLTPDGQNMVSAKTMSYDREISHFVDFLETGLNNHKNGVSFGNGAFSGNVTKK